MCRSEPWGAIAVPMEAHSKQRGQALNIKKKFWDDVQLYSGFHRVNKCKRNFQILSISGDVVHLKKIQILQFVLGDYWLWDSYSTPGYGICIGAIWHKPPNGTHFVFCIILNALKLDRWVFLTCSQIPVVLRRGNDAQSDSSGTGDVRWYRRLWSTRTIPREVHFPEWVIVWFYRSDESEELSKC